MNINNYPEIKAGKDFISKIYVAIMLWIVGRAIQAASRVDKEVKKEFAEFPEDFMMCMSILPFGPHMVVGKDKNGKVKYMGWNPQGKKITLTMNIKSMAAAMQVFTFQESTTTAFAHDRFTVDGDIVQGLAVVRVLNIVEVYLLPKIITKLAVKRYPKWSEMSPLRKWVGRIIIYVRAFTF